MNAIVCVCVTNSHNEGVHKYWDHSHLHARTHKGPTDNGGCVTGESELQEKTIIGELSIISMSVVTQ